MSGAGDSVQDAIEEITDEDLVRPLKPAKKIVYLSEKQGNDKNDGLSLDRAVRSRKRGLQVARMERTQEFNITGTASYIEEVTKGKMKVKE